MRRLRDRIREFWAGAVRPHLPASFHRVAARVLRALGLEGRLLHWLIPACNRAGFASLSWPTADAVYRGVSLVAKTGPRGDYYEFGLYRGFTLWLAQQASLIHGLSSMRFFGFDSFRGLPPLSAGDAVGGEFHQGQFACDRATVKQLLQRFGVDWSRTELFEGFYQESLKRAAGSPLFRPVAVALIDCDLYESAVPVLDFLGGLLQEGSVLLFDDWNSFSRADDRGERRAFREFLEAHREWDATELFTFGDHGQAFTMHHSARRAESAVTTRAVDPA